MNSLKRYLRLSLAMMVMAGSGSLADETHAESELSLYGKGLRVCKTGVFTFRGDYDLITALEKVELGSGDERVGWDGISGTAPLKELVMILNSRIPAKSQFKVTVSDEIAGRVVSGSIAENLMLSLVSLVQGDEIMARVTPDKVELHKFDMRQRAKLNEYAIEDGGVVRLNPEFRIPKKLPTEEELAAQQRSARLRVMTKVTIKPGHAAKPVDLTKENAFFVNRPWRQSYREVSGAGSWELMRKLGEVSLEGVEHLAVRRMPLPDLASFLNSKMPDDQSWEVEVADDAMAICTSGLLADSLGKTLHGLMMHSENFECVITLGKVLLVKDSSSYRLATFKRPKPKPSALQKATGGEPQLPPGMTPR